MGTRPGWGQTSEERLPVRTFAVRDVSGWLEFEYEDETEERRGDSITLTEDREEFSEEVYVSTRSYVFHPYLVDINFDIGVEAKQGQREFSPAAVGASEGEDLFADTILADVTFLKRKPVVTNVFYQRQVTEQDPQGLPGFEVDSNSYGGSVRYNNSVVPSVFSASLTTREGLGADRTDEEDIRANFAANNQFGTLDTRVSLDYEELDDTFRGTLTETSTADLLQNLRFGNNQQHLFSNAVTYVDETGTLTREELNVREEVRYEIADRWRSRARANYQTTDFETDTIERRGGAVGLSHDLYESLHSEVQVDREETESDTTDTTTTGGQVDFRYRKLVPGGRLNAGVHVRQEFVEENAEGVTQLVSDEPHTFGFGQVLLDNPNVDLNSVVITDPTGVILYIEGIDYVLLPRGLLTEVVRQAAGGIPPGGSILVDYRFGVSDQLEYESLGWRTDARLDLWRWFSIRGMYSQTDRTVTKGEALNRAQDRQRWLVESEARYRQFTLTAGYEDSDSGLTAFDRQYVRMSYWDELARNWRINATGSYTLTSYSGELDEELATTEGVVSVVGEPRPRLRTQVDGWLRQETGRETVQDTQSLGVRGSIQWTYRQFEARLAAVYVVEEDTSGLEQERQEISVRVRRWF